MDLLASMALGFGVATTPVNLLMALLGVIIGTFVGILPGLGVSGTIAILMPVTFGMNPATSLILMAGVYAGARYGGSTTAIMMNLPGESSAVVTCLDGYQLALQGRAGAALGLAAVSSFVGGTLSVVGLMLMGPLLASVALRFTPPEFCTLTLLGLCLVTSLSGKSVVKGLLATCLGLAMAMIGSDLQTGASRLTFGRLELLDGISFITVAVGLFALGEILVNVERQVKFSLIPVPKKLSQLLPAIRDLVQCIGTWITSFFIGFFVGVLPGTGPTVASFLSYATAKSMSRTPERFGKGAVEGVAAAELADNACTGGALVPMFTLGIPGSTGAAMIMAVLIAAGVRPGPVFIAEHPDIFWGVVASMYIANIMLLVINLPLIPIVVNILRMPYYILYIVIIVAAFIGVYSVDYSTFDLWMMALFGIIGYAFKKLDYPPAALLLALILSPMTERALRQSLILSNGDLTVFLRRPGAAFFLVLAVLALFYPWIQERLQARSGRRLLPAEEGEA